MAPVKRGPPVQVKIPAWIRQLVKDARVEKPKTTTMVARKKLKLPISMGRSAQSVHVANSEKTSEVPRKQVKLSASSPSQAEGARVKGPPNVSKVVRKQARSNRIPRKSTVVTPVLLDGGVERIGAGSHRAMCAVKILQSDSSEFFGDLNGRVKKSEETSAWYGREAAKYPIITSSTVVKCRDGAPLLYFIKSGMFAGQSLEEQDVLSKQSLEAIGAMIKVYTPRPLSARDPRSKLDRAEQKRKWAAKRLPHGKYNYIYNYPMGRHDQKPRIHSHSRPVKKGAVGSIAEYMEATTWEHEQVSKWIEVLDPEKHRELHQCYQGLGEEEMEHLYQGPNACQSGLVLLVNVAVHPHKDPNDAKDNWTSTNIWENCEGGLVAVAELGIRVDQKPGDLLIMHAAVLTHFVGSIRDGQRFCHVRFTKADILKPPKAVSQLSLPCPFAGCPKICNSEAILRTHLKGRKTSGKSQRRANRIVRHSLGHEEIEQIVVRTLSSRFNSKEDPIAMAVD